MAGRAGFRIRDLLLNLRGRAIALPLIAAIAGCQASGDIKHATGGIGDDLYSSDLAAATRNLEIYFGFICKQANIPTLPGPDNYPQCDYASIDGEGWTIIVQTGFNDIDRRCDGYLEWLEQERHRAIFVNSQINSVGRLTNQVLTAVVPTAGLAIGIVSEAFGFAKSAFNDYQTLIMLGYEPSTIKTIVSERRLAFRVQFSQVVFKYKPDAVNALRSYLRICMPYTITMDANAYARALATGNGLPNYVNPGIERDTIVGENALAGPITATTTVFAPFRGEGAGGAVTLARIDRAIQLALCVDADGAMGPKTEEAIRIYKLAENIQPVDAVLDDRQQDAIINRFGDQAEAQGDRFGACSPGILNYLERTLLKNNPLDPGGLADLRTLLRRVNNGHSAGVDIADTDGLDALRKKIVLLREKVGGSFLYAGEKAYLNEQWTPDLRDEASRLTPTIE